MVTVNKIIDEKIQLNRRRHKDYYMAKKDLLNDNVHFTFTDCNQYKKNPIISKLNLPNHMFIKLGKRWEATHLNMTLASLLLNA